MTDIRCVPCAILTWPNVVDLLPDQKMLVVYLWFNRFANSCGCYVLPRGLASYELSFSEASLNEALKDFERRNIVALDDLTLELFVLAWFRFNTFKTAQRQSVLRSDLKKIQSSKLRAIVEKSISCIPREVKPRTSVTKSAPVAGTGSNSKAHPGESADAFEARMVKEKAESQKKGETYFTPGFLPQADSQDLRTASV